MRFEKGGSGRPFLCGELGGAGLPQPEVMGIKLPARPKVLDGAKS